MKGLRRVLVTAAVGGLAAASVAASAAFACTPIASVEVQKDETDETLNDSVEPGDTVEVETRNFWPGKDVENRSTTDVKVVWQRIEVDAQGNITRVYEKVLGETPAPGGEVDVAIPADAVPGVQYRVSAFQYDATAPSQILGANVGESPLVVVKAGAGAPPPPPPPPPPPGGDPLPNPDGDPPANNPPVAPVNTPVVQVPIGLTQPAGTPARSGNSSSGVSGSRPVTGEPAAAQRATPGSGVTSEGRPTETAPANTPAAPGSDAALLDLLNSMPQPATNDLWSGLDPRTPGLADGLAPAEGGSGLPVGGLLLGGGGLALVAVALVEGRRRLAVSRVTLR